VRPNDVFFALHALLISAVTLLQVFLYERGGQTFSLPAKAASAAILLGAAVGAGLAAARPIRWLDWLAYLNALAAVKLGVTLVKYLPQLLLNARRRSTAGWSIDNVCLDLCGGLLSLTQLLLDAGCSGDWSAVSGDPVKFGLGLVSIVYDGLFLLQHFVWYRRTAAPPLLPPAGASSASEAARRQRAGSDASAGSGLLEHLSPQPEPVPDPEEAATGEGRG